METYNKKVATNDDLELILISLDEEAEDALDWAKEASFPWPHILLDDKDKHADKWDFMKVDVPGVPFYMLVDETGKILAKGHHGILEKAGLKGH